MALVNTPLNGPEGLPSMPPAPQTTENPPSVEGGIYAAPEAPMASVAQPTSMDKINLQAAEEALLKAGAPLNQEEQFVKEIYNLIIEDDFFSRLQEESKQKFLNDFDKFVREQIIIKQIDKTLDQEHISDMLFKLYFPYAKKISWAYLQQDAFNDAEKLMKFLEKH